MDVLASSKRNPKSCGGTFDVEGKQRRLDELEVRSSNPEIWQNPDEMQKLNKERALLERAVSGWKDLNGRIEDSEVLLEMALEEKDEESFSEFKGEIDAMQELVSALELKKLLNSDLDGNNAFISINSGAGGTEACDWAGMLMRMYSRYAEKNGFKVEILEMTEGEEAGIKSVTMLVQGPYAYGYLNAESGVHRLVRISPFDSNARRHTSFASVFAWAEVEDDIEVEIKQDDLRIDTYRASGAGGQHVNRTDSAVRITHEPTGIVVQCQTERSQHANRDRAMKMLKGALYERELEKRNQEKQELEAGKKANEWGSQIRSYVMHPYQMVKDHRTSFETSQVNSVMDGAIDELIMSFLKWRSLGAAN